MVQRFSTNPNLINQLCNIYTTYQSQMPPKFLVLIVVEGDDIKKYVRLSSSGGHEPKQIHQDDARKLGLKAALLAYNQYPPKQAQDCPQVRVLAPRSDLKHLKVLRMTASHTQQMRAMKAAFRAVIEAAVP